MPGPVVAEEICVSARSSGAAIEAASASKVDAVIARTRDAIIHGNPLPPFDPAVLVRYISPEITRKPLEVRAAGAIDPSDPSRGWVAVEAIAALGRSDVPLHLTALVDVSESMESAPMSGLSALQGDYTSPVSRLELTKAVLSKLAERLPARSEISLLAFVRDRSNVVLPPTPASEQATIERALRRLHGDAVKTGNMPLDLAYDTAGSNIDGCVDRRVLVITDDRARFTLDPEEDAEKVRSWAARGIELWTLSLGGWGRPSPSIDMFTEAGRGISIYADTLSEAVEPLTAALRATGAVGQNPSISVSFGPAITSFRRIDGVSGAGTDTWTLPQKILAGYRAVQLYEVTLGEGTPTFAATSRLESPVPGEWQETSESKGALLPLREADPLVAERVLAWRLGSALVSSETDWTALAAWAGPLVRRDGPGREMLGWISLMKR